MAMESCSNQARYTAICPRQTRGGIAERQPSLRKHSCCSPFVQPGSVTASPVLHVVAVHPVSIIHQPAAPCKQRRGSAAVSTQHLLLFLCFFTILCVTLWFNLFASVKMLENRSIHVSDWIICFQSLHCGSATPGVQAQIPSAMAHNRQYSNLYTSAALCPAGETKERTQ